MLWTIVLGTTLALVGAVNTVPQAIRTLRTRDTQSLSLATQMSWVLSWGLWAAHSLHLGAYPKAAAELTGMLVDLAMLVLLLVMNKRAGASLWKQVAGSSMVLAPAPFILIAGWVWGPVALAIGLSIFDAIGIVPQLAKTMKAKSLAGVSLASWLMRVCVYSGWIVYAVGIHRADAAGWPAVMLPAAVLMVTMILIRRRQAALADGSFLPAVPSAAAATAA